VAVVITHGAEKENFCGAKARGLAHFFFNFSFVKASSKIILRGWWRRRASKRNCRIISIEETIRFIETPNIETDLGKRDRAILEVLYGTGARVAELVKIDLNHIDFKNKMVRLSGKRRKERIVPFGDPALHALMLYLSVRNAFAERAARRTRLERGLPKLSRHAHHHALRRAHGR
jgi:site-specific recombinase XerD